MHQSSFHKMDTFARLYLAEHKDTPLQILDFGSAVVDEQETSYRSLFEQPEWTYTGLDIAPGHNVHLVVEDAFNWPLADDTYDLVISGQALEHVDYFWVSAFEIARVLKPGGIAVLIAPSAGPEHRFPIDCWRFYRDGFDALGKYLGFEILDSFTDWDRQVWGDSIIVMRKPVWDDAERADFAARCAHQKAALAPGRWAPPVAPEGGDTSALVAVTGGALGDALHQVRRRNLPLKSRIRETKEGLAERWPDGLRLYRSTRNRLKR